MPFGTTAPSDGTKVTLPEKTLHSGRRYGVGLSGPRQGTEEQPRHSPRFFHGLPGFITKLGPSRVDLL